MKASTFFTRTFLITLLLFTGFVSNAQRMIKAEEVTPDMLKNICEDAAIKVLEAQNSYVKIKETFSIYLDIDSAGRYVLINSTYNLVDGAKPEEALALINKLNREVILIQCYYNESKNTINYKHYFWIEGGFSNRSLVSAVRMFSSALSLSLQKDTAKLIK